MKTLKLTAYVAVLCLVIGCKKDDPDPDLTSTTTNYAEYYLDGVKHVPTGHDCSFVNGVLKMDFYDTVNSMASILLLSLESFDSVGTYYINDSNAGLFDYIGYYAPPTGIWPYDMHMSHIQGNISNDSANLYISEINYVDNEITGTFKARVGPIAGSDDTTFHDITQGVFNKISINL